MRISIAIYLLLVCLWSSFTYAKVFDYEIDINDFRRSGATMRVPSLWFFSDGEYLNFYRIGGNVFDQMEQHVLNQQELKGLPLEQGEEQLALISNALNEKFINTSSTDNPRKVIYMITDSPAMPCPPCDAHLQMARMLMKTKPTVDIHVIRVTGSLNGNMGR